MNVGLQLEPTITLIVWSYISAARANSRVNSNSKDQSRDPPRAMLLRIAPEASNFKLD